MAENGERKLDREAALLGEAIRGWRRVQDAAAFSEWLNGMGSANYCGPLRDPIPGRFFQLHAPLLNLAVVQMEVFQGAYDVLHYQE